MRNSTLLKLVLSAALVLAAPVLAFGVEYGSAARSAPNYVAAKLGVYVPSGDLDDLDFDTGFNGEIVFGRYFHDYAAGEVGIGYMQTESGLSGLDWDGYAIPVTVSIKGVYPMSPVELYLGVGVGLYFVNLEVSGGDDDDTVLGGHVMLGGNFDVTTNVFLGIEGKYIFTDEADFFGAEFGDLNGFIFTGNLGYRF